MRRPVSVLLCAVAMSVLAAHAAVAAKPFQTRITDPASFVLPGDDFCRSDVQVDIEQKFKLIEFAGTRGTWISAITVGKITARLENVETGESVRLSIPGPGFIDAQGRTVRGTGPWLIFVPGELLFVRGHMGFVGTPPQVEPVDVRGRIVDLCQVLS